MIHFYFQKKFEFFCFISKNNIKYDNNNFKKLDKIFTNSHEKFWVNKNKNNQIEKSKNDLAKSKINYRYIYEPISKNYQLNKTSNTIIFRNKTKKIQIFLEIKMNQGIVLKLINQKKI